MLTGTLTRANWDSSIASGTGASSQFVLTQMMTCPQFVASGATSTLGFIEQLPNAGPDGLVVLDANGMPTTIRWGTKVTVVTDPAAGPANLGCSPNVRYLAVLSVTAAPA